MIKFALKCDAGHRFEGWFRSGNDFEGQSQRGIVSCAVCGSTAVEKALMRPAIGSNEGASHTKSADGPSDKPSSDKVAVEARTDGNLQAMKELWGKLQEQARSLRDKSEYVGPRFAEEARKIHYGETEKRGVYGEASRDEVDALKDEGILAMPLPRLPEDQN